MFAHLVMAFCQRLDASVIAWGRTEHYNAQLGKQGGSPHTLWLAADVVYDRPVPFEHADQLAHIHGLALHRRPFYDHLEPRGDTPALLT